MYAFAVGGPEWEIEGDWVILLTEFGKVFEIPRPIFSSLKPSDIVTISIEIDELGYKEANNRIENIRLGLNRVEI